MILDLNFPKNVLKSFLIITFFLKLKEFLDILKFKIFGPNFTVVRRYVLQFNFNFQSLHSIEITNGT